ncbi:MAG TPA: AIR synthase-related protein, partial [Gemmatimonadaceae bacterium]
GDPFTEKLLLEASLELIRSGHIVAIQDMGAAGLTSSSAEMAARGDVGVTIDTSRVPVRETGMTPYEILLSESQERMLVIALKGHEDAVRNILFKWDLTAEVIGEVIAEPVYRVTEGDRVVAEFPGSDLVTECPRYNVPAEEGAYAIARRNVDVDMIEELAQEGDPVWTLLSLLSAPTIASKRWAYQQYDSTVRTNTVIGPGGDAAVLRIRGTDRAIALKTDCNGRYVALDPRVGGSIAVAEAARNVACTGARPLAITNCLNFGNPTRPEVFFQFKEAVAGIREACIALETPVTGGNVSFYNESPTGSVHPTPVIGMLGVIDSLEHVTRSTFRNPGDAIVLLGDCANEIGGSEYLATIHGVTGGRPPACDLARERAAIDALLECVRDGIVASAHDCSDGGLAVALAECVMANPELAVGADVDVSAWDALPIRAVLFGETQARVIISTGEPDRILEIAAAHSVPARRIGTVTALADGLRIRIGEKILSIGTEYIAEAYHTAIPRIMDTSAQSAATDESKR